MRCLNYITDFYKSLLRRKLQILQFFQSDKFFKRMDNANINLFYKVCLLILKVFYGNEFSLIFIFSFFQVSVYCIPPVNQQKSDHVVYAWTSFNIVYISQYFLGILFFTLQFYFSCLRSYLLTRAVLVVLLMLISIISYVTILTILGFLIFQTTQFLFMFKCMFRLILKIK